MPKTVLIEVSGRKGAKDPIGENLARDVRHLGLAKLRGVSSAQLYKIAGDVSSAELDRIGRDLLSDPVTQEYSDGTSPEPRTVVIDVWFKAGVTDVVGESVMKGIHDLKIKGVEEVRTGMRYRLHGTTSESTAEKIGFALLINPLVHETSIHAH